MKTALEQTIETEIIPRLLIAHRGAAAADPVAPASVREEDVAEFAHLILEHEISVSAAFLDVLSSRGLSAEQVMVDLLAPVARRLGEMWERDERDFVEVTIALSRIQHLVRALSPAFQNGAVPRDAKRHALLVPTPGEQHTLGIMIVEEFFRRSGWLCTSMIEASGDALLGAVRRESFDVVGLSASCETFIEATASAIDIVRKNSKNRKVIVIVGGTLFRLRPELVGRVGADAVAEDGTQALAMIGSIHLQKLNAAD
jgi:methanogenic corrinoid protein MtbC1